MIVASAAWATTFGPLSYGWLVPDREDAPTDARPLFGANHVPDASVESGAEAPRGLLVDWAGPEVDGAPVLAVAPPAGGWAPTEERTVRIVDGRGEAFDLTFGTGPGPAPDPIPPDIVDISVGDWKDRTRALAVTVQNEDGDPWSYVELRSDFALTAGIGPGEHTLEATQRARPVCYAVAAVAVDGDDAELTAICLDAPAGCGCRTRGSPAPTLLALAGLAGLTRIRRAPRGRRGRLSAAGARPR